jgi:heme A synthase
MKNISRSLKAFRVQTLLILVALVLEFVLGMYTALFVQFPDTLVNGNAWSWSMTESPIIFAHVLLGTLLFLLALSVVVFGFASRNRNAIVSSIAGLVLTGVAYMSGSAFLSNVALDNLSFSMSLGFLGSILAYFAAFYTTRPEDGDKS